MSLRDEINRGLREISDGKKTLSLDEQGRCTIPVPMPPSVVKLNEGRLVVTVELARSEHYFSLSTPLAEVTGEPGEEFYRALLYRQRFADQTSGVGFALDLEGENDRVVGIYHWMLQSIDPEAFSDLFQSFVGGALSLIEELQGMSQQTQGIYPLHPGAR
jgi:hypothetical protein